MSAICPQKILPASSDARGLALHLGGRWYGTYGAAPCPVCQPDLRPDQNALTIAGGADGRLLLHCKKDGCSFRRILATMGAAAAVTPKLDPIALERRLRERQRAVQQRVRIVRTLWHEAAPIAGSLAEGYLRRRRTTCALPETLRFHPACRHGASGRTLPAMLALIEGGEGPAIQRTWLSPDGSKAAVEPSRAMLGSAAGGAVQLARGGPCLVAAEGIETALSLASGFIDGESSLWATLSTSGMRRLRLPERRGALTIAGDGDPAGRAAAQVLAGRADRLGWQVEMMPAPEGMDWNDVLRTRGRHNEQ